MIYIISLEKLVNGINQTNFFFKPLEQVKIIQPSSLLVIIGVCTGNDFLFFIEFSIYNNKMSFITDNILSFFLICKIII